MDVPKGNLRFLKCLITLMVSYVAMELRPLSDIHVWKISLAPELCKTEERCLHSPVSKDTHSSRQH